MVLQNIKQACCHSNKVLGNACGETDVLPLSEGQLEFLTLCANANGERSVVTSQAGNCSSFSAFLLDRGL